MKQVFKAHLKTRVVNLLISINIIVLVRINDIFLPILLKHHQVVKPHFRICIDLELFLFFQVQGLKLDITLVRLFLFSVELLSLEKRLKRYGSLPSSRFESLWQDVSLPGLIRGHPVAFVIFFRYFLERLFSDFEDQGIVGLVLSETLRRIVKAAICKLAQTFTVLRSTLTVERCSFGRKCCLVQRTREAWKVGIGILLIRLISRSSDNLSLFEFRTRGINRMPTIWYHCVLGNIWILIFELNIFLLFHKRGEALAHLISKDLRLFGQTCLGLSKRVFGINGLYWKLVEFCRFFFWILGILFHRLSRFVLLSHRILLF
jgi:hypothetical protein